MRALHTSVHNCTLKNTFILRHAMIVEQRNKVGQMKESDSLGKHVGKLNVYEEPSSYRKIIAFHLLKRT